MLRRLIGNVKSNSEYFPLANHKRKDALEILDELVNESWAEYHRNVECISLRSWENVEVREFLKENSEMEEWVLESLF